MTTSTTTFAHERVRVTDLLSADETVLDDLAFDDCTIVGPAVLLLQDGTRMMGSDFGDVHDPSEMLWTVKPWQTHVLGAVSIRHCVFDHCRFEAVAFAAVESVTSSLSRSIVEAHRPTALTAGSASTPRPVGSATPHLAAVPDRRIAS